MLGVWEQQQLEDLFEYERPDKYIVKTTDYSTAQLVPVLTANKGFILGYTEEKEGIHDNTPTILFDDFTCDMKYVNFKFKVKSSAMKLLYMRDRAMPLRFGYELLKHLHYQPQSHSRHWISIMQSITTVVPSVEEQQKIADFFRHLDGLINLHQRQTKKLTELKQGLLHEMFPREGESVPRLRFPGFTTTWKQQKFKDTFTMMQNNTLSRADLNNESGNAYDIHYGDILTIFNEYLDVTKQKLPYINANASFNTQKYSQSALQNGDVIMADTAEDTTVGKCVEITGVSDDTPVFAGLHTIPLRSSHNFGPGYLAYYLNSAAYHDQLYPFIQGIKVDSIGKSALQMTTIMFPSSYDEQKQIGSFFRTLDDLLALHEQYTVKLIHLKKGLLQKMFPQD